MAAKLSQILLLYLVQMNAIIDDEEEELVVEESAVLDDKKSLLVLVKRWNYWFRRLKITVNTMECLLVDLQV